MNSACSLIDAVPAATFRSDGLALDHSATLPLDCPVERCRERRGKDGERGGPGAAPLLYPSHTPRKPQIAQVHAAEHKRHMPAMPLDIRGGGEYFALLGLPLALVGRGVPIVGRKPERERLMNRFIFTASMLVAASSAVASNIDVAPTTVTPLGTVWYETGSSGGGFSGITGFTGIDADGSAMIQGDRTRFGNGNIFNSNATSSLGLASNLARFSFDFLVTQQGATVLSAQAPALRVVLRDPTNSRRIEIVWEDGEQNLADQVFVNGAGTLNTIYSGNFFGASAARVYPFTAGSGRGLFDGANTLIGGSDSAQSFAALLANLPATTFITGISLGVGSSVGTFIGYSDHVDFAVTGGIDTTMNFVPTPSAAALLGLGGLMAARRRRN